MPLISEFYLFLFKLFKFKYEPGCGRTNDTFFCLCIFYVIFNSGKVNILNFGVIITMSADTHTHTHTRINLSDPTGHMMHQQFNIQQLYILPTLYLCVLYLSENKQ